LKLFIFCFGYFNNLIQVRVLNLLEEELIQVGFENEKSLITYYGVNKNRVSSLLKKISEEKPTHIIGLGSYRKDGKKIRVEQEFINKYGRNLIVENGIERQFANWEVKETSLLSKGNYAGNGPCNLISYKILREIDKASQKYVFFHIPRGFDADVVKDEIVKVIKDLRG
jgi:pyrrolidone-carboxylate peptidase